MRGSGLPCSSSFWPGKTLSRYVLTGYMLTGYSFGFLLFYRKEQLNRP
jgi:hypothetical protein